MTQEAKVQSYFAKLGFEPEIANIYNTLHLYGPQSISQLARNANVERTRLYRLINTLKNAKLVEVEVRYKREILRSAPIANLQLLLDDKKRDLQEMQTGLKDLYEIFPNVSMDSPTTRVQFYQGVEGNKQMFWNETRAKSEVLCVLYENMQGRVGQTFFDRWVSECNKNDVKHKGIIGDQFMKGQTDWYEHHQNERLQGWEQRTVSADIFPVTHSIITYDNVVAYYNWRDGEAFGIEIYNEEIAKTQRRFLELLWRMGVHAKDIE